MRRDDEIARHFHVAELVAEELGSAWNVAPTQGVRVVLEREEAGHVARQLRTVHWGLVPCWAKDTEIRSRMINARAETITDKPAFRRAAARGRAIVDVPRVGGEAGELIRVRGVYTSYAGHPRRTCAPPGVAPTAPVIASHRAARHAGP